MQRRNILVASVLAFIVLAGAGWWWKRNHLAEVPLASDEEFYEPSDPGYGRDGIVFEVLIPDGPRLQAFLRRQAGEPLVATGLDGKLVGLLADGLERSENLRHWRIHLKPGIQRQDGGPVDSAWLQEALRNLDGGPFAGADPALPKAPDARTLLLDFKEGRDLLPDLSGEDRLLFTSSGGQPVGTGPFQIQVRDGAPGLSRFLGFRHGKAGFTGLRVATDPTLMESHRWSSDMVAGRYAFSVFPGQVDPDDMARVRTLPYQEVHFRDGTVWFVSTRLRRFRTDQQDWTRIHLFSMWLGDTLMPLELKRP